MNEQKLQAIEERAKRADGMNITNAVHDSDGCTHADYTFVEWALEDVPALIAEVRRLRAKLDAVPEYLFWCLLERDRGESVFPSLGEWIGEQQEPQP